MWSRPLTVVSSLPPSLSLPPSPSISPSFSSFPDSPSSLPSSTASPHRRYCAASTTTTTSTATSTETPTEAPPKKKRAPKQATPSLPVKYDRDPQSIQNPSLWKFEDTLLYYVHPKSTPSSKIAIFGFNKALVSVSLFKRGPDAWRLRYEHAPQKLKELHEKGYRIVIFSNHSPIGRAAKVDTRLKAIIQQCGRTGQFVESVGIPIDIFVATASTGTKNHEIYDKYRKPERGMWDFFTSKCNGGVDVDLSECFFVGGHVGDLPPEKDSRDIYTDYDVEFAKNINVKFVPDSDYFGMADKVKKVTSKKAKKTKEAKEEAEAQIASDTIPTAEL